jgi:radical SAM protein with 4Fe4S-binding SPASM domain
MDFEFFKRITREMRDSGVEEIGVFYIGESATNPKLLVDAIRNVKQIGFPYCFLTTNGSLMGPYLVEDCMKAGLDSLKFSVNACDDEQFEDVMGVKNKWFKQALGNIAYARVVRDFHGFKCGLYASSIQFDGEQAQKMEDLLNTYVRPHVDEHYFLPLFGQMAQLDSERSKELGFVPTAGNQGRVGALRQPLPCWAVFTEGHVRADGHMSACCFGADNSFDMGDLTKQTFTEAWNSAKFRELRLAHLKKNVKGTVCENCMAYAFPKTLEIAA